MPEKAIVHQIIPVDSVTDIEIDLLNESGFTLKKVNDEAGPGYIMFVDDTLSAEIEYSLYDGSLGDFLEEELRDHRNNHYTHDEEGSNTINYTEVLSNILDRTPALNAIEVTGSFYPDKFKLNFMDTGGWATLITRNGVYSSDTSDLMRNMYAKDFDAQYEHRRSITEESESPSM